MPKAEDSDKSAMTASYSARLLVVGPRKIPPEPTNLFVEEKMTQATEAMFWEQRLAPLAYPM